MSISEPLTLKTEGLVTCIYIPTRPKMENLFVSTGVKIRGFPQWLHTLSTTQHMRQVSQGTPFKGAFRTRQGNRVLWSSHRGIPSSHTQRELIGPPCLTTRSRSNWRSGCEHPKGHRISAKQTMFSSLCYPSGIRSTHTGKKKSFPCLGVSFRSPSLPKRRTRRILSSLMGTSKAVCIFVGLNLLHFLRSFSR